MPVVPAPLKYSEYLDLDVDTCDWVDQMGQPDKLSEYFYEVMLFEQARQRWETFNRFYHCSPLTPYAEEEEEEEEEQEEQEEQEEPEFTKDEFRRENSSELRLRKRKRDYYHTKRNLSRKITDLRKKNKNINTTRTKILRTQNQNKNKNKNKKKKKYKTKNLTSYEL